MQRISAAEAANRLGVKRETIYAYVSRGLLTSERHLDGKSSTFDPGEIDRLRRRKNDTRPGRLEVPVASAVTEVLDGSVAYRGHALDALVADGHRFEAVAELLWTGILDETGAPALWPADAAMSRAIEPAMAALPSAASTIDRMMASVVAAAAADPFRHDRSIDGVLATGRRLVRTIVDALPAVAEPAGSTIAERLWSRLTPADAGGAALLDLALVCLADHGMATSTLAARLAASTRAAPAALLAGLGAVSGPLHGAASGVVHDLFVHAERDGADTALAAVVERDGRVPGLGHFIHRSRDPRHDLLMDALAAAPSDRAAEERLDVVASVVARTAERIAVAPNVDLALGALTFVTGMDRDAGEAVFATARTAGWLAHTLEEYDEAPIRFRPVGRYEPGRATASIT